MFIIYTLVILMASIAIHEFAHLQVARWLGLRVSEYAIGFGKRVVGWQYSGVDCSVRAMPLGGFVKIPDLVSVQAKDAYKAIAVYAAGPVSNLLFAGVLCCWIIISPVGHFSGVQGAWDAWVLIIVETGKALAGMLHGDMAGLGGPISLAHSMSQVKSFGLGVVMAAGIQVGLFFFNLLPLPILDGGQIVLALVTRHRGKDLSPAAKYRVFTAAAAALLFFAVFLTGRDIVVLYCA